MLIDRPWLERVLGDLVRINSVNPLLSPGAPGEREIAAYVAQSLSPLPLVDTRMFEPATGRITVLGTLRGSGGGPSLMFNAHSDTVAPGAMEQPFVATICDGKLFGRGAYDMKGSLAASLAALKALAEAPAPLAGDVFLAAVADEEYGSLGTSDLLRYVQPDAAIVTEPTSLQVCLAHKGYLWIEVETTGRAAHGSRFDRGTDANLRMGRFLTALEGLEKSLRVRPPHPLVGPPSLHAAMLSGGTGLSTYAASSKVQIERRTIPGETEAQVFHELQSLVNELQAADPTFRATVRPYFVREPFEVRRDARIVQTVAETLQRVTGTKAIFIGDTPWMDAALLAASGVETVVVGPTGGGAHADEEWVDLDSVAQLAQILAETAVAYCGRQSFAKSF
ncbi:MAG: ArgE/DapE family deacylase [Bryobacteraceae bacterium]